MELEYYEFLPDEKTEVFIEDKGYYDMISQNDFLNQNTDELANKNFRVFEKMNWKNELAEKIKVAVRENGYANVRIVEDVCGGGIAGAIMVSYTPKSATIEYILTFEKYRGKGIAEQVILDLLKNPKEFGVETDIKEIDAFVSKENIASQKIFQKAGFEIKKVIDGDTFKFVRKVNEKSREIDDENIL